MSERLYALLLALYPSAFRERYADEMMRVFRDRLRDEPAARVWTDVVADAVVSIPRQYWRQGAFPMLPPSAAPLKSLYRATLHASARAFLLGAAVGAGVAASVWMISRVPAVLGSAIFWVAAVPALGLYAFAFARTFQACKAARKALYGVRVAVLADSVTTIYEGAAPATLMRSDVRDVRDYGFGLRIETADPARDLWIPASVPAYATAKESLSVWTALTQTPAGKPWQPMGVAPRAFIACAYLVALLTPLTFSPIPAAVAGWAAGYGLLRPKDAWWVRALSAGPVVILLIRVSLMFAAGSAQL